MQVTKDATYSHAHCLSRGLQVLRALNEAPDGDATARHISERTRLNRSTVKRILETLVTDGYVRPCGAEGSYRLLPEVAALSKGLTLDARLLDRALPVLGGIARDTRWSLRLATARGDQMVIRVTTHAESELADRFTVGLRHGLPILLTASGRAYLASCGKVARDQIIDSACAMQTEQTPLARNPRLIELMVRRVLDDGYSLNDGDWGGGGAGAVALPIKSPAGDPVGCLSMLYPRPGMSRATIEREFLPTMRSGVSDIEASLA